MTTLLLIDDSTHVTELFAAFVERSLGWRVLTAAGPGEVTAEVLAERPDVVVADLVFPGSTITGVEVLRRVRAALPEACLVAASSGDDWVLAAERQARAEPGVVAVLDITAPLAEQLDLLVRAASCRQHVVLNM